MTQEVDHTSLMLRMNDVIPSEGEEKHNNCNNHDRRGGVNKRNVESGKIPWEFLCSRLLIPFFCSGQKKSYFPICIISIRMTGRELQR